MYWLFDEDEVEGLHLLVHREWYDDEDELDEQKYVIDMVMMLVIMLLFDYDEFDVESEGLECDATDEIVVFEILQLDDEDDDEGDDVIDVTLLMDDDEDDDDVLVIDDVELSEIVDEVEYEQLLVLIKMPQGDDDEQCGDDKMPLIVMVIDGMIDDFDECDVQATSHQSQNIIDADDDEQEVVMVDDELLNDQLVNDDDDEIE